MVSGTKLVILDFAFLKRGGGRVKEGLESRLKTVIEFCLVFIVPEIQSQVLILY